MRLRSTLLRVAYLHYYPGKYPGGKASRPFNEKTLPKFARIPESQRVLYAEYTSDYHWGVPTQQTSYEGIQFVLSADEIYLREWPKLMSSRARLLRRIIFDGNL